MGLTNTGKEIIAKALMGDAITEFDHDNAYLGVGDSDTAFNATQTDLQGANKKRVGMETSFPSRSTTAITWKSSFGADDGNWNWKENAVFNAASAGEMLARDVEDLGTKVQGAVWVLTKEGTIT
jgi:hypothetical protein